MLHCSASERVLFHNPDRPGFSAGLKLISGLQIPLTSNSLCRVYTSCCPGLHLPLHPNSSLSPLFCLLSCNVQRRTSYSVCWWTFISNVVQNASLSPENSTDAGWCCKTLGSIIYVLFKLPILPTCSKLHCSAISPNGKLWAVPLSVRYWTKTLNVKENHVYSIKGAWIAFLVTGCITHPSITSTSTPSLPASLHEEHSAVQCNINWHWALALSNMNKIWRILGWQEFMFRIWEGVYHRTQFIGCCEVSRLT